MNITNNVSGKCKLKCKYSFNYSLMDLTGKNRGSYLLFIPNDSQRYDQAIYNNNKYKVKEIRIYKKSIHNYGGRKIESELMIIHETNMGLKLNVCIPIKIANGYSITIIDRLVAHMSKFAPSKGGNAGKLNLPTFTLNDIVPKKKYLVHSGNNDFPVRGEYIVFKEDSPIYISSTGYKKLSKLIQEHKYNKIEKLKIEGFSLLGGFKEGNENMVASEDVAGVIGEDGEGGDNTFYDCVTVDEDDEEQKKLLVSSTPTDPEGLFNNSENDKKMKEALKIMMHIAFAIFILILMTIFAYGMKKLFGGPSRQTRSSNMLDIPPATTSDMV